MKKSLSILIDDDDQYFSLGLGLVLKAFFRFQQQPIQFITEKDIYKQIDLVFLGNTHVCPAWIHDVYKHGCYPYIFFIKDRKQMKTTKYNCGAGTFHRHESVVSVMQQLGMTFSQTGANVQVCLDGCKCMSQLSQREIEVMKCLAAGLKGVEAAKKLSISQKTVHAHKNNVMRKLNFGNKHELNQWLIQSGINTNCVHGKYGAPWDIFTLRTTGNEIAM